MTANTYVCLQPNLQPTPKTKTQMPGCTPLMSNTDDPDPWACVAVVQKGHRNQTRPHKTVWLPPWLRPLRSTSYSRAPRNRALTVPDPVLAVGGVENPFGVSGGGGWGGNRPLKSGAFGKGASRARA